MRLTPQQYFQQEPVVLQETGLTPWVMLGVIAGLLALGISLALLIKK